MTAWVAAHQRYITLLLGQVSATFAIFFTASGSFLSNEKFHYTIYRAAAVCQNFILQLFWFLEATFFCDFYEIFLKNLAKKYEQSCLIIILLIIS